MNTPPPFRNLLNVLSFCVVVAIAGLPCLAQTAQSAGAVRPEDAGAGDLAQTNIWVLLVLGLAIAAIVVAIIFRKKPADLADR